MTYILNGGSRFESVLEDAIYFSLDSLHDYRIILFSCLRGNFGDSEKARNIGERNKNAVINFSDLVKSKINNISPGTTITSNHFQKSSKSRTIKLNVFDAIELRDKDISHLLENVNLQRKNQEGLTFILRDPQNIIKYGPTTSGIYSIDVFWTYENSLMKKPLIPYLSNLAFEIYNNEGFSLSNFAHIFNFEARKKLINFYPTINPADIINLTASFSSAFNNYFSISENKKFINKRIGERREITIKKYITSEIASYAQEIHNNFIR